MSPDNQKNPSYGCSSLEEFRALLSSTVANAVEKALGERLDKHYCIHRFESSDIYALKQLSTHLKILGNGDILRGVEMFKEHNKFVQSFLSVSNKIGMYVVLSVVGAVLVLLGSTLFRGFIDFVRNSK